MCVCVCVYSTVQHSVTGSIIQFTHKENFFKGDYKKKNWKWEPLMTILWVQMCVLICKHMKRQCMNWKLRDTVDTARWGKHCSTEVLARHGHITGKLGMLFLWLLSMFKLWLPVCQSTPCILQPSTVYSWNKTNVG